MATICHYKVWHVDHLPAWRVLWGEGSARVVQYIDTVLYPALIVLVKCVDSVSERISSWFTVALDWGQLVPSILSKRVPSRLRSVETEDELIFEICQIGVWLSWLWENPLWPFNCEASLWAIHLEDPIAAVFDLKQARLPDLAADPEMIWEVCFLPSELKPLPRTWFSYSHDMRLTIYEVEHLWLLEKHLHPGDPNGVPPRVETLQSELLYQGQVPYNHKHRPVVLIESRVVPHRSNHRGCF